MRTASCLTLLAIGAILTFAVTGHPSFLNLQVAGLVIMATGVAGLFLPRRGSGWLRRWTVLCKGPPPIPEVPGEDQAAERESPGDRFRPVASEVVEEYIEE
jgi:hypothetical protein